MGPYPWDESLSSLSTAVENQVEVDTPGVQWAPPGGPRLTHLRGLSARFQELLNISMNNPSYEPW